MGNSHDHPQEVPMRFVTHILLCKVPCQVQVVARPKIEMAKSTLDELNQGRTPKRIVGSQKAPQISSNHIEALYHRLPFFV